MGSFDTIRHLPQAYRRLSRFRHILRVLFKYGFDTISLRERVPQAMKRLFMPWRKDETTEIAAKYKLPLHVRSSFDPVEGTRVVSASELLSGGPANAIFGYLSFGSTITSLVLSILAIFASSILYPQ